MFVSFAAFVPLAAFVSFTPFAAFVPFTSFTPFTVVGVKWVGRRGTKRPTALAIEVY